MTIIAARKYRDGKPVGDAIPAGDTLFEQPEEGADEFSWTGLFEPTADEISACAKTYSLHPLAVEDALHAHQLPKLEIYGDQLFIVVRTAKMEGGHIAYGETSFFVGRNHIISVRHGSDQRYRWPVARDTVLSAESA